MAILLPADLLWFASGRNVQTDRSLYFPSVPILKQVAQGTPGRVIGYRCLPAQLAGVAGLTDVRGYDAVDPEAYVELLGIAAETDSPALSYALTQWLVPKYTPMSEGNVQLSPVLDLLGVRYVVFRGQPPLGTQPAFSGTDYWVLTNSRALPRAFVPRHVQTIPDRKARLQELAAPGFDPRETAYVEQPLSLPDDGRGTAQILNETPNRITLQVAMESPGLVVLADRWDPGWQARLDGKAVPILRANHALRGILVPAGKAKLEFLYRPASMLLGFKLAAVGFVALCLWAIFLRRHLKN
jgi:hypothetical protein